MVKTRIFPCYTCDYAIKASFRTCYLFFVMVKVTILFQTSIASCSCLTSDDRDILDCAAYHDKRMHSKVSKSLVNRWEELKCSSSPLITPIQRKQSTDPIYYLSTDEGFASHMVQYNVIWNWAVAVNRTVITFDFRAPDHYGDSYYISVCDIFVLPESFQCLGHEKQKERIRDSDCVFFRHTRRGFTIDPSIAPVCKNINVYNLTCLAAMLFDWDRPDSIHLYPPIKYDLFQNYTFQPFYDRLFHNWIVKSYNMNIDNTVVFHWRRGDQLLTRCKGMFEPDNSVNCGSPQDFVGAVNKTTATLDFGIANPVIYISTNEGNSSALGKYFSLSVTRITLISICNPDYLRSNGYIILQSSNKVELTILDIMVSCRAKLFYAWGASMYHRFIRSCRSKIAVKEGKELKTFVDGRKQAFDPFPRKSE